MTKNAKKSPTHHAETLSFMRLKTPAGTGIDYWVVEPTGRYGEDCDTGAKLGEEYLSYIGEHPTNGNATLLGCIVADLVRQGQKISGVEIGFLRRVNEYAMTAARHLHALRAEADKSGVAVEIRAKGGAE